MATVRTKLSQNAAFRFSIITISILWLGIIALQSLEILRFGTIPLSLSWVIYNALIFLLVFITDISTHFSSQFFKLLYYIYFLYSIVFNFAIIYDWYSISTLINRFEHIFGSLIIISAVYELFRYQRPVLKSSTGFKLLVIVGIANIFGVTNEIIELLLDAYFNAKSIGPQIWDTNMDLLMNFIGFGIFITIYYLFRLGKRLQ